MKRKNVKVNITHKIYELGVEIPFVNCAGEKYTINEMIDQLNKAKVLLESNGFHNVVVSMDSGYENTSVEFFSERPETDGEMNKRITLAAKNKEKRKIREEKERIQMEQLRMETEKQEKELLAKLKKKYETV